MAASSIRMVRGSPFTREFEPLMSPPGGVEMDTPLISPEYAGGGAGGELMLGGGGTGEATPLDLVNKVGKNIGGYTLTEVLGIGTFAAVYEAQDASGHSFAVKTLFKKGMRHAHLEILRLEADIHEEVSDFPNVVTLVAVIQDEDCMYLVLEKCDRDLYQAINDSQLVLWEPEEVTRVFGEVAAAVAALHASGIAHRDIKPENILLTRGGGVRLADFGLATRSQWSDLLACGTRAYLAPEALEEDIPGYHPYPADVWALGVLFVTICFRSRLWESADPEVDANFREFTQVGAEVWLSTHTIAPSRGLAAVLSQVFDLNPRNRPSAKRFASMVCDLDLDFYRNVDQAPANIPRELFVRVLLKDQDERTPPPASSPSTSEGAFCKRLKSCRLSPPVRYRKSSGAGLTCDSGVGASLLNKRCDSLALARWRSIPTPSSVPPPTTIAAPPDSRRMHNKRSAPGRAESRCRQAPRRPLTHKRSAPGRAYSPLRRAGSGPRRASSGEAVKPVTSPKSAAGSVGDARRSLGAYIPPHRRCVRVQRGGF